MLAASGVLYKLGVSFNYIENCSIEDKKFKNGVFKFIKAATVAKVINL